MNDDSKPINIRQVFFHSDGTHCPKVKIIRKKNGGIFFTCRCEKNDPSITMKFLVNVEEPFYIHQVESGGHEMTPLGVDRWIDSDVHSAIYRNFYDINIHRRGQKEAVDIWEEEKNGNVEIIKEAEVKE